MQEEWFFTFGSAHVGAIDGNLANCYMKVQGSFNDARAIVHGYTNGVFAFQYSKKDFGDQHIRYQLREVELQEVHRV